MRSSNMDQVRIYDPKTEINKKSQELAKNLVNGQSGRLIPTGEAHYDSMKRVLRGGEVLVVVAGKRDEVSATPIYQHNAEILIRIFSSFLRGNLSVFQIFALDDHFITF